MNAGQELTTRKNFIYDTKTNELIAEVEIKDEDGKRYKSMKHILDRCDGWREEDYDGYNDYFVNPEYHRSERTRKRIEKSNEELEL